MQPLYINGVLFAQVVPLIIITLFMQVFANMNKDYTTSLLHCKWNLFLLIWGLQDGNETNICEGSVHFVIVQM